MPTPLLRNSKFRKPKKNERKNDSQSKSPHSLPYTRFFFDRYKIAGKKVIIRQPRAGAHIHTQKSGQNRMPWGTEHTTEYTIEAMISHLSGGAFILRLSTVQWPGDNQTDLCANLRCYSFAKSEWRWGSGWTMHETSSKFSLWLRLFRWVFLLLAVFFPSFLTFPFHFSVFLMTWGVHRDICSLLG